MYSQVTFQKQNIPFEAEPNTARPQVEISEGNLILSFPIKGSNTVAQIIFTEPLMYRVGDPNDEGFYGFGSDPQIKNNSIFSRKNFPDLDFWDFYRVDGIDWKNNLLGEETEIVDKEYKSKENFSHFVFFMKDGTFECVTKSYRVK